MASAKLVIDLGTSNTNIYKFGSGLVLSEPTVCAVSVDNPNEIKAVGSEAKKLIGKTAENTKIVFPIFEGEIVNEKIATKMVAEYLKKIEYRSGISGGMNVVAVPCGAEVKLIKKYEKVLNRAGLSKLTFIEEPILSAIGQRIPLSESTPCFVIDMGGGTTNIAAVSLDGVITGISVNFGGSKIDVELIDYIADKYNLQIGLLTAERIKIQIGSLIENDTLSTVVNGRDILTGKPRSIAIKADDVIEPIKRYYDTVAELATSVLAKLPPEVSAEIRHSGIYIAGGTAKITGLEQYYKRKFMMGINIAEEPEYAVAFGGGIVLGDNELCKRLKANIE